MKKGVLLWLIFLVVLGVLIDYSILHTRTWVGTNVTIKASAGDLIVITGTSSNISVIAADDEYFRVLNLGSGEELLG